MRGEFIYIYANFFSYSFSDWINASTTIELFLHSGEIKEVYFRICSVDEYSIPNFSSRENHRSIQTISNSANSFFDSTSSSLDSTSSAPPHHLQSWRIRLIRRRRLFNRRFQHTVVLLRLPTLVRAGQMSSSSRPIRRLVVNQPRQGWHIYLRLNKRR